MSKLVDLPIMNCLGSEECQGEKTKETDSPPAELTGVQIQISIGLNVFSCQLLAESLLFVLE